MSRCFCFRSIWTHSLFTLIDLPRGQQHRNEARVWTRCTTRLLLTEFGFYRYTKYWTATDAIKLNWVQLTLLFSVFFVFLIRSHSSHNPTCVCLFYFSLLFPFSPIPLPIEKEREIERCDNICCWYCCSPSSFSLPFPNATINVAICPSANKTTISKVDCCDPGGDALSLQHYRERTQFSRGLPRWTHDATLLWSLFFFQGDFRTLIHK